MARFDLDTQGFAELGEELSKLQEQGESDRAYKVGTNTEYAIYLEMGTRDMPPYPWFRPAIVEFQVNPEKFILKNTAYSSIDQIPTADALTDAVANALVKQMEDNVSADTASGRSPGTKPDHPKRDLGNLVASINATRVR